MEMPNNYSLVLETCGLFGYEQRNLDPDKVQKCNANEKILQGVQILIRNCFLIYRVS